MTIKRKEVFFFDGTSAECVLASDYDAVIAEAERFRFLLRHAHDALDYHYYPVLRGLIRKALGEPLNEHGQLTRDSLDKLEDSSSDLGLNDDLGTIAGIKRMDEERAAADKSSGEGE